MKLFVTGTDTGIGKTYVSVALLQAAAAEGKQAIGLKPIASGCDKTPEGLRNADALALQAASTYPLAYEEVNPIAFEPPIAPMLAAAEQGVHLQIDAIRIRCQSALTTPADLHIIEGIGGWLQPLNEQETLADWVIQEAWPVICVVGMRLGCINHALLTLQAIQTSEVDCKGWIANCMDETQLAGEDNIALLKHLLPVPHLGTIRLNQPNDAQQIVQVLC